MSFGHFAEFYGVLYTPTSIFGCILKSVTAYPKVLTLNSYKRINNLDIFFKLVLNRFCRIQGFMSVIEDHRDSQLRVYNFCIITT